MPYKDKKKQAECQKRSDQKHLGARRAQHSQHYQSTKVVCPTCGHLKTKHSSQCQTCEIKRKKYRHLQTICPDCGGKKDYRASRCQQCAIKNHIAWNKGKHWSQSLKDKLSIAHKGQVAWSKGLSSKTDERVAKRSENMRGQIRPSIQGGKHPMYGKHHTKETKAKLSLALKGKIPWIKGKHHTEETKTKMHTWDKGHIPWNKGKSWDEETLHKIIKSSFIRPTKPEKIINSLLDKLYPNQWQYTGDGTKIIGGKNPDFWNGDHRLMELYGDYWHKGENPQDKIEHYAQHGYKCLVIWEHELKQPEQVINKIIEYAGDV